MSDKPKDIFSCENMPWEGLEKLFKEMNGEVPENPNREITLPDIAVINHHAESCPDCQERLNELSKRYGFGEQESAKGKREIK